MISYIQVTLRERAATIKSPCRGSSYKQATLQRVQLCYNNTSHLVAIESCKTICTYKKYIRFNAHCCCHDWFTVSSTEGLCVAAFELPNLINSASTLLIINNMANNMKQKICQRNRKHPPTPQFELQATQCRQAPYSLQEGWIFFL